MAWQELSTMQGGKCTMAVTKHVGWEVQQLQQTTNLDCGSLRWVQSGELLKLCLRPSAIEHIHIAQCTHCCSSLPARCDKAQQVYALCTPIHQVGWRWHCLGWSAAAAAAAAITACNNVQQICQQMAKDKASSLQKAGRTIGSAVGLLQAHSLVGSGSSGTCNARSTA